MTQFYGSLCLTDIPKELITEGKNGKKYLNIEVGERRQPSQYGATHYIKASVRQEQRQEGINYYIGELKPSRRRETAQQPAPQSDFNKPNDNGDMPF